MGECGHAYRVAKRLMPFFWGTLPFQVVSIFTLAEPYIRKGAIRLDPSANPMLVTYHDPCNYTRSCGMVEEPRTVLKACVENFIEMTPNRYENWCCGGGGGLAILDGREGLSAMNGSFHDYRVHTGGKKKLEQVKRTGADYVAAPCANCKRQLGLLMQHHGTDVQVGGIFDLLGKAAILNH
jgi:Fe-S oxidoreductase